MNTQDITAIATIIISVSGLLFSIFQARQTIKHNKLSVKPKLLPLEIYRCLKIIALQQPKKRCLGYARHDS